MSSTMTLGGHRRCTLSIHWPGRSARAARFSGRLSHLVSKRPIWLAEVANPLIARSPTTQRIARESPYWLESQKNSSMIHGRSDSLTRPQDVGAAMGWRQGQSYSEDPRARVLAAIDSGMAARSAA